MSRFTPRVARRALAPAAVLVLALVAGCTDEPIEPAATVNGIEISQQEVVDELESIQGNPDYLAAQEESLQRALASGGTGPASVLGSADGTFDTAFVAQLLGLKIRFAIIEAEVQARGIDISGGCTERAEAQVVQQVGGQDIFDAFDDDFRAYLVTRFANLVALESDLAGYPCVIDDDEALLEDYFDSHPDSFPTTYCVTILQATDADDAASVVADLAAGADYDELAAARATSPEDTEPQCVPEANVAQVLPELLTLEAGDVASPVELPRQDGGTFFAIARLEEIVAPTFENSRAQVITEIGSELDSGFGAYFQQAVAEADVTVDPRYGTWDPVNGRIDRPAEAGATTTTAPGVELDPNG